jgi:phosphoribosylglycinamide formyltransferase 1
VVKKIVILTGEELRHEFIRKFIANSQGVSVAASYCEGVEKSLKILVQNDIEPNTCRLKHLRAREQSEQDFFQLYTDSIVDQSKPTFIPKGSINDMQYVAEIIDLNPDLIIAYGCSIIKSELLDYFPGRFINVHLGLSPYYRGSGTNYWPLVNGEPEFVGATFMYIDKGIDTGEVIHQIRSKVEFSDSPVQIGNRLIVDIASEYVKLIRSFSALDKISPDIFNHDYKSRYYQKKDYTEGSVEQLYKRFSSGMIEEYFDSMELRHCKAPIAVNAAIK